VALENRPCEKASPNRTAAVLIDFSGQIFVMQMASAAHNRESEAYLTTAAGWFVCV